MKYKRTALKAILVTSLISATVLTYISSRAEQTMIEIPYKDKPSITFIGEYEGMTMSNTMYDVNGDGIFDVSELRRVFGINEAGQYIIQEEPIIYGFDINQNGTFDTEEVLVDPEEDGLNGNEKKLTDIINQTAL